MLVKLTGVKKLDKTTMKHVKGGCNHEICTEQCNYDTQIMYALNAQVSALVDIIIRLPI